MIKRGYYLGLWNDLSAQKKMILLSGPRQTGKTTLAKEILSSFKNSFYFNWDIPGHKKMLINNPRFFEQMNRVDETMPLIVLDEIHKYRKWKSYLKGIYDGCAQDYKFLVSGSGRLDLYQKGGDSLAGRYFQLHLYPFTTSELGENKRSFNEFMKTPLANFNINKDSQSSEIWRTLSTVGGFPEPFANGSESFYIRWSKGYVAQIIREDIRSISDIKQTDNMELLYALLSSKVGSPLSMNNLAEDLQVSFGSIKEWLRLMEVFYLIFRLPTWTKKISRAILKEKKLYLFNYTEIDGAGARFENMVALELLRATSAWNDYGHGRFALHYIRNKDSAEADFLISNNNKPFLLLESKLSDDTPAKSLLSFQQALNVPAIQLVNKEGVFKMISNDKNKILITTAHRWLSSLP